MSGPPRLRAFDYIGTYRYFVTCCTRNRQVVFVQTGLIERLTLQILQSAKRWDFAVLAYTFMPDHLHLLVEGTTRVADFRAFMKNLRKRTTLAYQEATESSLWQDGYFERVLRHEEITEVVANYILANPVRAGLVERVIDYPFGWSITVEMPTMTAAHKPRRAMD
jgi:REP-associated tyrosine transposase